MQTVFKRTEVYHITRGNTLVAWELTPLFQGPQPYRFEIHVSRSGLEWELVGEVTDSMFFIMDTVQRIFAVSPRLYYRVTLYAGGDTYTSPAVHITRGKASSHDDPLVNEILRKEMFLMQQYTGRCGFLYKRRHRGTPCPVCVDYDTGESKQSTCPTCYGTGITGGYYAPVVYWIANSQPGVQRRMLIEDPKGTAEDSVIRRRGLVCPWLDSKDIWVDMVTDSRYCIQTVQDICFRQIPIIYDPIEMRLVPSSDVVYTLTRPDLEVI